MYEASPELLALQAAVVGRYSLVRELGRGGMGVVFLARDVALDRPVAIKLLASTVGNDAVTRERFLREARTAARLSHPHIVPVHAVEEKDGLVFFVMAFLDGETLGQRVQRDGPLDAATLHRLTREVAWSLGYAHGQGVVHRDVKPENILIERATGRALVADFGIARNRRDQPPGSDADTSTPGIVGTPRYMSPEQLAGGDLDGRSDLYSLGLVMTFAATADAPPTVVQRLQGARASIPLECAAGALATVADRCLEVDPAARYPNAEALLRDLDGLTAVARDVRPSAAGFLAQARAKSWEIVTATSAMVNCLLMVRLITMLYTQGGNFLAGMMDHVIFQAIALGAAGYAMINAGLLVWRARKALAEGETADSLADAALSVPYDAGGAASPRKPNAWRVAAALLVGVAGTLISLSLYRSESAANGPVGLLGLLIVPVVTFRAMLTELGGAVRRSHPLGWLTRVALRVAAIGRSRRRVSSSAEPTVAVTAQLASELFTALPAAKRDALGDVEGVIRRLERAAGALRRARSPAAEKRRAEIETAMEAIRLDLMRLHYEKGDEVSTTADLDAAVKLGEEIVRQVEARREVDRLVRTGDTPA